MYICPVCGYNKLRRPPEDFLICPSCGTQFEYHDAIRSHAELSREWMAKGMKWHSISIPEPPDWNPYAQLDNLEEIVQLETADAYKPKTEVIEISDIDESKKVISDKVVIFGHWQIITEITNKQYA